MSFTKGATLLLRDSLPAPEPLPSFDSPFDPSTPVLPEDQHVAITNHKLPVYERVGSILIPLTEYVREAIFPLSTNTTSAISSVGSTGPDPANPNPVQAAGSSPTRPTHLVDAYCGSGLFGITLSPHFERVAGVEISQDSITAAKKNAEMNGLGEKTEWLCGKAEDIFGGLPEKGFEGSKSCVVVDVSGVHARCHLSPMSGSGRRSGRRSSPCPTRVLRYTNGVEASGTLHSLSMRTVSP
jgi:tRNA (uracil-5-)-methyltransferase